MSAVKPLVVTLAVLAVLGGGAVAGDMIVRDQAEQRVADAVQSSLGLEAPPTVSLGGVPFSTALVTRTVPDATLSAVDVPFEISDQLVAFSSVEARAQNITLSDDKVELGSATVAAVLPYDALSTLAGVPVGMAAEGRLEVSYTGELFGQSRTASVSAVPVLDVAKQQIRLTETELSIEGFPQRLSVEVAQSIMDSLVRPIPLKLPYDVTLAGLTVQPDGLVLNASAENVTVPLQGS